MNKKVLILSLAYEKYPYGEMVATAMNTWDSIEVEDCETVFYFGSSSKKSDAKNIYLPIEEGLFNMGRKTLLALEWALNNKEFDYILRPHSCIYVDKKELIKYIQDLPDIGIFGGVKVERKEKFDFIWGGTGFIFSRDIVKTLVDNKHLLGITHMEDEEVTLLASNLGIPFFNFNKSCSIDRKDNWWACISYCEKSKIFSDFSDLKGLGHINYRVKQDGNRAVDKLLMEKLYNALK
ncbi:MAG TPA: hypothetical protein VLS85_02930 [Hanamia sp.]|nr:hypothetical protein [Hanamia sp.]